jgi:hypothetical protein
LKQTAAPDQIEKQTFLSIFAFKIKKDKYTQHNPTRRCLDGIKRRKKQKKTSQNSSLEIIQIIK